MDDLTPHLWRVAAVLVIVLLNAFFVAFEYALVTVRHTRVRELIERGSASAAMVERAIGDLTRFVSAVQVGVTMCSLAIGWLGEPAIAAILGTPLRAAGLGSGAVHGVSFVVAFLMITYLHVVVGEIVPKTIALQRAEAVALRSIRIMSFFSRLIRPLVIVLNGSAERLLQAFGMQPALGTRVIHSEEELKMLVSQSQKGGVLEDTEQEMLYNVFDFADKDVAEVMVPRPDVVAFDIDEPPAVLLQRVVEQPYTRYPVYRDTMDDVVGILHVRDLFNAAETHGKDKVRVDSLLRPAHVVPESKSLAGLLADFRRSKSHMALVVDEYGSLAGIVTLEDLLEEIVGEIVDEHDVPEQSVERISENHLRVDGKLPLDELNEMLGLDLPNEHYHTVGGFVFDKLGQAPHEGDMVRHENIRFEVTETDGPRIVHVDIFLLGRRGSEDVRAVDSRVADAGASGESPNGLGPGLASAGEPESLADHH